MEEAQEVISLTFPATEEVNNDDNEYGPTVIPSLCTHCGAQGVTNLLLSKIPFFKEIIIMAFTCKECSYKTNEIKFGGEIAEKGQIITVKVTPETLEKDLRRGVVKSEYAQIEVPELELEVPPPINRSGEFTNIEGVFKRLIKGLKQEQPSRKYTDPETYEKIQSYITKLKLYISPQTPGFTFILTDVSGNSFIENPFTPAPDSNLRESRFERNIEQNHYLGIGLNKLEDSPPPSSSSTSSSSTTSTSTTNTMTDTKGTKPAGGLTDMISELADAPEEVMGFETPCSVCGKMGMTKMIMTSIPHFKEVVIMAFSCEHCGYKNNEVKAGGAIGDQGTRLELVLDNPSDLDRSILKSETASILIPEIDFEVMPGSFGGKFTTIEGVLKSIRENLLSNPFLMGDSADVEQRGKAQVFMEKFGKLSERDEESFQKWTLVMDDPVGNSHIQNVYAPDDDPNIKTTHYTRTWEQNEELGLNDIKTENYS